MTPHPKIRKTTKWGGLVVAVMSVTAWCASLKWEANWVVSPSWRVSNLRGMILLSPNAPEPWAHDDNSYIDRWIDGARSGAPPIQWWIDSWGSGPQKSFGVALWIPAALGLFALVAAWRLDVLARRGARANLCTKCHYDRSGLAPGAVCPECGAAAQ